MMDVSQAALTVALQGRPASAQAAPKRRTTSSGWTARLWNTVYVNFFGGVLHLMFFVAAWAMWWLPMQEDWDSPWLMFPWRVVALLVCSLPYVLSICAASLYRSTASSRYGSRLLWQGWSANPSLDSTEWGSLAERAEEVWDYEWRRFSQGLRLASLHGLIFGLVSSLTLFLCTMILEPYLFEHGDLSRLELIVVAVGTATAFAFANDLGRILFRVALRDAGSEIFSFATKNSILVVASALLFSTLLCSGLAQLNDPGMSGPGTPATRADREQPALRAQPDGASETTPEGSGKRIPLGVPGFVVIGATIAIIGGRAVSFVSDRAASVLGLVASRAAATSDLNQIEGLGEEDIGRLAEEGVDSLHALAFIPLPRLLFNTRYGLERLCDWQDQALLLTHVGQAKARLLREHMLVRGAIAAQDAARRFFASPAVDRERAGATAEDAMPDKIANLLGFATHAHAEFALNQLANDEFINRLRVYATAAQALEHSGDERRPSGAPERRSRFAG